MGQRLYKEDHCNQKRNLEQDPEIMAQSVEWLVPGD